MISKTYLVTGATGFIGAAFAKQFIEQGSKVVTIDNLSTSFRESIHVRILKFFKKIFD